MPRWSSYGLLARISVNMITRSMFLWLHVLNISWLICNDGAETGFQAGMLRAFHMAKTAACAGISGQYANSAVLQRQRFSI